MSPEVWQPVPVKPGLMASSWGRILLPAGEAVTGNGGVRRYQPKPNAGVVTRSKPTAKHSYRGYWTRKFGNIKIHQAVCEAFHGPKPFPKAVVIHINEDAHDNRPENLRWGTQKENLNAPGFIAWAKQRTGENSPRAKWNAGKKRAEDASVTSRGMF